MPIPNTLQTTRPHHEELLAPERVGVEPPRMYKVLLLNDDYTPMDFVVSVLQNFFAMPRERAIKIMLQVHHEGQGLCGVFTRDIAATKVAQVTDYARQHEHPLCCTMEES